MSSDTTPLPARVPRQAAAAPARRHLQLMAVPQRHSPARARHRPSALNQARSRQGKTASLCFRGAAPPAGALAAAGEPEPRWVTSPAPDATPARRPVPLARP